jgi:hypothetical protein
MGTAHGAEELGLCPHGLDCQAGAWGRYTGFCLGYGSRYGHIWKTYYELDLEKYSARPITLAHNEILTNEILESKAWDAGDADCGIARVNRATRGRYWHILSYKFSWLLT